MDQLDMRTFRDLGIEADASRQFGGMTPHDFAAVRSSEVGRSLILMDAAAFPFEVIGWLLLPGVAKPIQPHDVVIAPDGRRMAVIDVFAGNMVMAVPFRSAEWERAIVDDPVEGTTEPLRTPCATFTPQGVGDLNAKPPA